MKETCHRLVPTGRTLIVVPCDDYTTDLAGCEPLLLWRQIGIWLHWLVPQFSYKFWRFNKASGPSSLFSLNLYFYFKIQKRHIDGDTTLLLNIMLKCSLYFYSTAIQDTLQKEEKRRKEKVFFSFLFFFGIFALFCNSSRKFAPFSKDHVKWDLHRQYTCGVSNRNHYPDFDQEKLLATSLGLRSMPKQWIIFSGMTPILSLHGPHVHMVFSADRLLEMQKSHRGVHKVGGLVAMQ